MTAEPKLDTGADIFIAHYRDALPFLLALVSPIPDCEAALVWDGKTIAVSKQASDGTAVADAVNELVSSVLEEQTFPSWIERERHAFLLSSVMTRGVGDVVLVLRQGKSGCPSNAERERAERFARTMCDWLGAFLDNTIALQLALHNAIHEVQNVLAPLRGASEYVEAKTSSGAWLLNASVRQEVLTSVATLSKGTALAHATLTNLLHFFSTKGQNLSLGMRRQPVDLRRQLGEAVRLLEFISGERGVKIHNSVLEPIWVLGDANLLRQLLLNVIGNAIKYSYASAKDLRERFVEIDCHLHDPGFRQRRVALRVANYGVGIMEDELRRVGTRGFRGAEARRERPIGYGIGAFVAMEIARLHEGYIQYKSRPAKQGDGLSSSGPHLVECTIVLPLEEGIA